MGCDVCGLLLAEDKAAVHRAWHQSEDERLDRLNRSMQKLLDQVRDKNG